MKLTEFNSMLESLEDNSKVDYAAISQVIFRALSELESILVSISPSTYRNSTEFYKAQPLINAYIKNIKGVDSKVLKREFFYALLLQKTYTNFSNELMFFIEKGKKTSKTPNKLLAKLSRTLTEPVLRSKGISGSKIKKVIADLYDVDDFTLITSTVVMTKFKGFYEIYISNIDDILIYSIDLPLLSTEDILSLRYDPSSGIVIGNDSVSLSDILYQHNPRAIIVDDLDYTKTAL